MKVHFTPRARRDLEEIEEYLDSGSPSGARNVLRSIETAIRFIGEQPYGAEKTNDPHVRVKLVLRYRYKIFYRVREETIEIIHIRHTSRRPWIGQ